MAPQRWQMKELSHSANCFGRLNDYASNKEHQKNEDSATINAKAVSGADITVVPFVVTVST